MSNGGEYLRKKLEDRSVTRECGIEEVRSELIDLNNRKIFR